MIIDDKLRFSIPASAAYQGESIAAATTSGLLSGNVIDLTKAAIDFGQGEDIYVSFTPEISVNCGVNDQNATLDFQVWVSPKAAPTVSTMTGTFTVTAANFNTTTDVVTATAHGIPNGTRVTVAKGVVLNDALPNPLAASTNYFIINATTDTFQLSATFAGTPIHFTNQGQGTNTFTWYAMQVGASGPIAIQRLTAPVITTGGQTAAPGGQVAVRINPAVFELNSPAHRYLMVRYLPSANLTAGQMIADIVDTPQDGRRFYTSGFTVS